MFAGNLEVDGGITATGEVQSPTIQALLDQIAQLQEQIATFQAQINLYQNANNKLETRFYTTETLFHGDILNISDLDPALEDINEYTLKILNVYDLNIGGGEYKIKLSQSIKQVTIVCGVNDFCYYTFEGSGYGHSSIEQYFTSQELNVHFDSNLWGRIKVAITAQFPNE